MVGAGVEITRFIIEGTGTWGLRNIVTDAEDVDVKTRTFAIQNDEDAPSCSTCGAIKIRNGSCYKCINCGATSGCA